MVNTNQWLYELVAPIIGRFLVKNNKYCNVIYYHDIVEEEGNSYMQMNLNRFMKQMKYIKKNGYETLRFDDFKDQDKLFFKKKRVLIAFDDGWLSNYTEIFDFMKSSGIKYNIFLTIGQIGKNKEYLNWDLIKEMYDSGLVGFGVHTYSHPDMSDLNNVDLDIEVNMANKVFHRELGCVAVDFCYPFGFYSGDSNEYLSKNAIYRRIYTSDAIHSFSKNNSIIFGRNAISNDDSSYVFKAKLRGLYNNVYNTLKSITR